MSPHFPLRQRLHVLLVDNHAGVRGGLAALLGDQADIAVVAQASGGDEALRLATSHRPDLLVFDSSMCERGAVIPQLRTELPDLRLFALTRCTDHGFLQRMLRAGVSGYMLKRTAAEALSAALRTVAAGGTYIDPAMAVTWPSRSASNPGVALASQMSCRLSELESQVLRLIAWGNGIREVAAQLGLSVVAATSCKTSAMGQLQLRSRSDILRYALAQHWLREDSGTRQGGQRGLVI